MSRPSLKDVFNAISGKCFNDDDAVRAARAVLELFEPETVTTVADLDALPVGSVLMTPRGAAELRDASNSGGRYLRTFNGAEHFGRFLAGLLPATVLHRGGDR